MKCGRTRRHRKRQQKRNVTHLVNKCDHESSYIELLRWATANGMCSCPMRPAEFSDTGRGMMASNALQAGDTIIAIPDKLLVTTGTVCSSDLYPCIASCGRKLSAREALCAFLLWERSKGRASFWYPYLQVLPPTYNTPVYWTESELAFLPRETYQKARQQIEIVHSAYQNCSCLWRKIEETFPGTEMSSTYDDFKWAWSVLNTRTVYMKQPSQDVVTDEADHYALAPALDLLNHSATAEMEANFNKSTGFYEIKTTSKYKKYEQVFICYGHHDNSRLFLEYGFILPHNQHNVAMFHLDDLNTLINHFQLKEGDRKLHIITDNQLHLGLTCNMEGLSWKLISALRILAMDHAELTQWQCALQGGPVSQNNEARMSTLAQHLCSTALHRLGATPVIDEDNLHKRIAISLHREQSDILHASLAAVT